MQIEKSNCKQLAYTCHELYLFRIVAVMDDYKFTPQPLKLGHFIVVIKILVVVRLGFQ